MLFRTVAVFQEGLHGGTARCGSFIFTNPVGNFWNLEHTDTFKIRDSWYLTYSAQDDTLG